MPLSATISTGLVKGRFGDRVVAGPNGDRLLVPARGRIDFVGMTPITQFPTVDPPVTMLRPTATGILDSEGYLCTPDATDPSKPGERMVLMQAPNDPDSTVRGWTWRGTPRFVNADGTRVHNSMEPFTFDLPFGDVPFDLVNAVSVPESAGVGTEQVIILAASAQAHAASADAAAEAAAEAAREVVGALPSKADLIDGKVPADQLPPAVGVTDEVVAPLVDMPETAAKIDARVAGQVAGKLDAETAADTFQTKTDAAGLAARLGDATTAEGAAVASSVRQQHTVRPVTLSSDAAGIDREYPSLVKPLDGPIYEFADSPATSMYWPNLVNLAYGGGSGFALIYSTDHAAQHQSSGIFKASSPSLASKDYASEGRIYRDDVAGSQTETPSVIRDGDTWRMFYQQAGMGVGDQSTLMATSTDPGLASGTFTRTGIVAQQTTNQEAGDGHTGYFKPFSYGGSKHAYGLYGGTEYGAFTKWTGDTWTNWTPDRRRLHGFPHLIDHIEGYSFNWWIKWFQGEVIEWRGRPWWIGLAGPRSAAGTVVQSRVVAFPLSADLRTPAARPVDITPPAQAWEGAGVDYMGNAIAENGRLFMVYRANGAQGGFGLMEVV